MSGHRVQRIGFTRLSRDDSSQGSPPKVSIIFVHGLRGHPQATWVHRQTEINQRTTEATRRRDRFKEIFRSQHAPSTPTNLIESSINETLFWPRDCLLEDIPEAEVWTYGYNADVIGGLFQANNQNSISQHGRDLAVKLDRHIEAKSSPLPIIFVAHSVGGVVLKDALRRSMLIQSCTKLAIFLGTPHRGSSSAGWGVIASNLAKLAFQDSNKRIVQSLEPNSEVLDNIHDEFLKLLHSATIKVHSFQEAKAMSGVKGLDGKVVDDYSSKIGSPIFETVESIDANHMEIARCTSRTDPRYEAIIGVIKQFMRSGISSDHNVRLQELPATQVERQGHLALGEAALVQNTHSHRPCHYLPFLKNRRFTGRRTILDTLEMKLFTQKESQVLTIVGLGGVGKTQIALQLAYWVKDNRPEYSVFWVPALGHASFEQAYAEIARRLDIRIKPEEDLKETVRRYLESDAAGKWFLIVDNADDTEIVLGPPGKRGGIYDYIPQSDNGLTVFTSRSREVATAVAGSDMIVLPEMTAEEALEFFEKAIFDKTLAQDKITTVELVRELTHLPLAIAQAVAYLNQNQMPLKKYLALIRNTNEDTVSLMSREFHDNTRYPESRNAVALTWLVSFDQICRTDSHAAQLLSFISCIEWKAIPQSILPETLVQEEMENAIGVLCGYAFLTRREEEDMFDMHRLVHIATRVWVKNEKLERQTEAGAIQHLASIFPWNYEENRLLWRAYLPHAQHALYVSQEYKDAERFELLEKMGQCLYEDRRFKEAISTLEETYQWKKPQFPEEHNDLLWTEIRLASAYLSDRRIKKATAMLEHVVAISMETVADDDSMRLHSEHELATAYWNSQRLSEAITLFERVVTIRKNLLAEDDTYRLTSEMMLSVAYMDNGQVNKAIPRLEYIVAIQRRTLAEDHMGLLLSEHNLGCAYLKAERISEAIEILEHVVTIQKTKLAEDDDYRIASESPLGYAYLRDGRNREAVQLLEHVVSIQRKTREEADRRRLIPERELGRAYMQDRRTTEAITLLEHVVAVEKELDDVSDKSKANSEYWLARAYFQDQRINEAITVFEHVVAIEKELDDVSDKNKANSESWLARAYFQDQRINEAITVFEHVVAVQKELDNVSDKNKANSEYWLAKASFQNQRINEAITLLEHIVAVRKELDISDEDKLWAQELLERAYSTRYQQSMVRLWWKFMTPVR
ncbi:TPR-like protein [Xylaria bambusicola]|uniref:TPR-like protein n=1 Tax=Xylaria bambusicola TaxID=326684 RepID=UPI00200868B1|nr:TPR-like protein [Xylaria bambusicola]KAI0517818.1 TPR-like protein [Xylaria bambusicola]